MNSNLLATCSGHVKQVTEIVPHPAANYVASFDESGRLVVWSYLSPKVVFRKIDR